MSMESFLGSGPPPNDAQMSSLDVNTTFAAGLMLRSVRPAQFSVLGKLAIRNIVPSVALDVNGTIRPGCRGGSTQRG
jgi:hypothetical protein